MNRSQMGNDEGIRVGRWTELTPLPRFQWLVRMATTHLLSRAVIRRNERVLLVQADGQPHTFLPGGHVEDGEGVEGCLQRELREELGVDSHIESYLGAVEHRWQRDGTPQYELNHCFEVRVPSLSGETQPVAQEPYLTFEWVPMEELEDVDLQPRPLQSFLRAETSEEPWWATTVPSRTTEADSTLR